MAPSALPTDLLLDYVVPALAIPESIAAGRTEMSRQSVDDWVQFFAESVVGYDLWCPGTQNIVRNYQNSRSPRLIESFVICTKDVMPYKVFKQLCRDYFDDFQDHIVKEMPGRIWVFNDDLRPETVCVGSLKHYIKTLKIRTWLNSNDCTDKHPPNEYILCRNWHFHDRQARIAQG